MDVLVRYGTLPSAPGGDYEFIYTRIVPLNGRDPEVLLKKGNPFIEDLWEYGLQRQFAAMVVSTCSGFKYNGESNYCDPNNPEEIEINPNDVKIYLSRIAGENVEQGIRGCVTTDMTTEPPTVHIVKFTEAGPSAPPPAE